MELWVSFETMQIYLTLFLPSFTEAEIFNPVIYGWKFAGTHSSRASTHTTRIKDQ